jgi:hypothetical protein
MLAIPNRIPSSPKSKDKRHAYIPTRLEPRIARAKKREKRTSRIGVSTGSVHGLGCRISFILNSQKRRESAKLEGGKEWPPSKVPVPVTLAAMATRFLDLGTSPSFRCPLVLSSDPSMTEEDPRKCRRRLYHLPGGGDTNVQGSFYVPMQNVVKQPMFKIPSVHSECGAAKKRRNFSFFQEQFQFPGACDERSTRMIKTFVHRDEPKAK